jgi:hypothetical protein
MNRENVTTVIERTEAVDACRVFALVSSRVVTIKTMQTLHKVPQQPRPKVGMHHKLHCDWDR